MAFLRAPRSLPHRLWRARNGSGGDCPAGGGAWRFRRHSRRRIGLKPVSCTTFVSSALEEAAQETGGLRRAHYRPQRPL